MTKIFGIVAEFNPFHNGHKMFVDMIREKYHPDVLIAVMSGNFVQRGDFAVLDKWKRSQIAVENGVDIVIELPFSSAVQPADIFARKSVELLNQIGVTDIVFGTEQKIDFVEAANKLLNDKGQFHQQYDRSYAENLNEQLQSLGINTIDKPNQLLGLNYSLTIVKNNYPIIIHSLVREPNGYSATQIREQLLTSPELTKSSVPKETFESLKYSSIYTWNDFYSFLRYKILTNSTNELQLVYQMVEGLNFKLKKEIKNKDSFDQFLTAVKSKRYTLARLRRLLLYVLMNVSTKEMTAALNSSYLRILGFNDTGRQYLNHNKKQINIPLITRVGKQESGLFATELKADGVWQLISGKEQNFGVIPYIKGEN